MATKKTIQTYAVSLIFALAALASQAKTITSEVFDTVIEGGRVMDPETNYDAVANIGIRQGPITRVSTTRLNGNRRIDAKGLGQRLSVLDGITTQLDLEAGACPPTDDGY